MQQTKLTAETESFAAELEKLIAQRQIVKQLMALRAVKAMSQADMAAKMSCSQSRISKLESGIDDDLRLGDLAKYAESLDFDVRLVLLPKMQTPLDEIKYHAFSIKRIFDKLAGLSTGDGAMTMKAAQMMGETAYNMLRMIGDSARKLLPATHETRSISVEVQEDLDSPTDAECVGTT